MRVKLINSKDCSVIDQFTLNKSLEDSIAYLKSKYIGNVISVNGTINFYMRLTKGVD